MSQIQLLREVGLIPGAILIQHVGEVSYSIRYSHVCDNMMIGVVFVEN